MQEPKHFRLGKRAYEAFHEESPAVWFDDLSHDYQMRWVQAARAVLEEALRSDQPGRPIGMRDRFLRKQATHGERYNSLNKPGRKGMFTSKEEAEEYLSSMPTRTSRAGGVKIDFNSLSMVQKQMTRRAQKYLAQLRAREREKQ